MSERQDWDVLAQIFAWTIRTTAAKEVNGMHTPYAIITGLKNPVTVGPGIGSAFHCGKGAGR